MSGSTRQIEIPAKSELASAEGRLRGAIARASPRARIIADAERVPTESGDVQRAHPLTNLAAADRVWRELPVDEIIARYSGK